MKPATTLLLLCFVPMALCQEPDTGLRRRKAIDAGIRSLLNEVETHGNDWNQWSTALEPCRREIKERVNRIEGEMKASPTYKPDRDFGLLQSIGDPPMYMHSFMLGYLHSVPESAEEWARKRPSVSVIIAFNKWLKENGVDLIFVPAPKVLEVYPDRFLNTFPPDRVIAPQMRRLLLELLQADVEVVDLLPAFLAAAHTPGDLLYLPADSHWSNRAQSIAAELVADRLARYPLVKRAMKSPRRYTVKDVTVEFEGNIADHLNPQQRAINLAAASISVTVVSNVAGGVFEESDNSPIVVIGDSYTHYYRFSVKPGSGIDALLANQVNLPIWNISSGAATTQPLKEFLRNPMLLKTHKVVVWVITDDLFAGDSTAWQMLPFAAVRPQGTSPR